MKRYRVGVLFSRQETMKAHVVLEAKEASVAEANQVLTGKTTCEQAAIEAFRKSKAARQAFAQGEQWLYMSYSIIARVCLMLRGV